MKKLKNEIKLNFRMLARLVSRAIAVYLDREFSEASWCTSS